MKKEAILTLLQDARNEQDAIKILTANEPTDRDRALFYAGQNYQDPKGAPIKFDHEARLIVQGVGISQERGDELYHQAAEKLAELIEERSESGKRVQKTEHIEVLYNIAETTAELVALLATFMPR